MKLNIRNICAGSGHAQQVTHQLRAVKSVGYAAMVVLKII